MKRKDRLNDNSASSTARHSKDAHQDTSRHPRGIWAFLLLLTLTCVVYWQVPTQDFTMWDDLANLVENSDFNPPSLRNILHYWKSPARGLYAPVTYTLWEMVALVPGKGVGTPLDSPLNPHAFHLLNLAIHILSVWAVFLLLRSVLRSTTENAKAVDWAACAGALLFGLHPVQVESVAWISGTKDLACGLFSILSVHQYLSYASAIDSQDRLLPWPKVWHPKYLTAVVFFLLAMLAKPTGVVTPLVAGSIAFLALKRPFRQVVLDLFPLLVLSGVFVILNKSAQQHGQINLVPFSGRLMVAGDAISFYLYKLFVPIKLCIHYGRTPQYWHLQDWKYLTAALPYVLVSGILAIMWLAKSTREPLRWLLTGAAIFVVGVLPVLGLVAFMFQRLSTVADHYLYLSMLGPALVLARLLVGKRRFGWWAATAIWLCVLGVLAAFQVPKWKNSETLMRHAVVANPQSWVGYNNLSKLAKDNSHFTEAVELARKALQIQPDYAHAHVNLGLALIDTGEIEEGTAHLNEARRLQPVMGQFIRIASEAKYASGVLCQEKGDFIQAIARYREAVYIKPENFEARGRLGICLKNTNQPTQAETEFAQALKFKPDDALTHFNMGIVLERQKKVDEAVEHYRAAVRLDPTCAEAHNNLGAIYQQRGDLAEAAAHYEKALEHAPDMALTHFNLAAVLGMQNKVEQAIEHYRETIRINPTIAQAYNNLGVIYQDRGDLAEAAAQYEKALEYAPDMSTARANLQRVLDEKAKADRN